MMTGEDDLHSPGGSSAFARLPTGAKLFLILSMALLPLAIIAAVATVQTTRVADQEARARLRVAATEAARSLAIELGGDTAALRSTLNALDVDHADTSSCARLQGVFAQQLAAGGSFLIRDATGHLLCGTAMRVAVPTPASSNKIATRIVATRGLYLAMLSASGSTTAVAFFPQSLLADVSQPSGFTPDYTAELSAGGDVLTLRAAHDDLFARRESREQSVGIDNLQLRMSIPSAPITSATLLSLLLPLVMWAAAAGIAWFVVDRLLIRPLQTLRRSVAEYVPGDVIDVKDFRAIPAQEIRELGSTFRAISRTVALHEEGLAEGLVRQTRLTREVHHRVKNNLQVISSLTNLHARAAPTQEASEAYSSIQRRVDALAVVHRNHFAEMEETRGLHLRSVIGELASNFRGSAPEGAARMGVILDMQPFLANQDVAVAVAFLLTELLELAISSNPAAQVHISLRPTDAADRAILRLSSPALVDSEALKARVAARYGRVLDGLSRQLRSKLHDDPLTGAYEIAIAVTGRD